MNSQQITQLQAAVLADADPAVQAAVAEGAAQVLADLYNLDTAADFWVWRTAVRKSEYTQQSSNEGSVRAFDWSGTGGFIARSQGERDAWRELFTMDRGEPTVNPSLSNVRAAFADIFSGAGAGAVNNRAHLVAVSKRKPTKAERVFVDTASGNGGRATPALLRFEGKVTENDMNAVLAGPALVALRR